MGEFCPADDDAPCLHPQRFRLRAAARADRPASRGRAQRLAPARRRAPSRRSDRRVRDLPALLRAGDLLVVNDTARDQGAAARRQGERRRGRGAGRARRGRRRRARAAAREQVAEGRARRCASPSAFEAEVLGRARRRRLAVSAALSRRPARAARAPRPRAAAALHRARRRRPTTSAATRPCSPSGRARSPRRRRRCTSTPRCSRRSRRAASSARAVTLHVGAGTFQPVRSERLAEHVMHSERFEVGAAAVGGDRAGAGARRPRRRGRHDQPARARVGGACAAATARRCAGARRDRPLHHAGLRVSRRRPPAHQLPPAEEHAADAGRGVRRPRAHPRALSRTRSPSATASSATATRCCWRAATAAARMRRAVARRMRSRSRLLAALAAARRRGRALPRRAVAYATRGTLRRLSARRPRRRPAGASRSLADAASGLRFPRRVLEVAPGRFWLVDMGSWEPGRGRLLEFELPAPAARAAARR